MVSVYLPYDALLQHLLSYLGFSCLGRGLSLHSCSSKAQPLLLTLDEGYLLTATPPDLECGVVPLGPPAPAQPSLQARILEWVAFPSPEDLPHPGIKPGSPALLADSLPTELQGMPPVVLANLNIEVLPPTLPPEHLACILS